MHARRLKDWVTRWLAVAPGGNDKTGVEPWATKAGKSHSDEISQLAPPPFSSFHVFCFISPRLTPPGLLSSSFPSASSLLLPTLRCAVTIFFPGFACLARLRWYKVGRQLLKPWGLSKAIFSASGLRARTHTHTQSRRLADIPVMQVQQRGCARRGLVGVQDGSRVPHLLLSPPHHLCTRCR